MDPDLHEFQQSMALAGIGKRQTNKGPLPSSSNAIRKKHKSTPMKQPLFVPDEDEDDELPTLPVDDGDDSTLARAIQESINDEEQAALQRAIEASRMSIAGKTSTETASTTNSIEVLEPEADNHPITISDDEDLYVPDRLATALSIAGAGPSPTKLITQSPPKQSQFSAYFGRPTLLTGASSSPSKA